jgi:hypothetical protein
MEFITVVIVFTINARYQRPLISRVRYITRVSQAEIRLNPIKTLASSGNTAGKTISDPNVKGLNPTGKNFLSQHRDDQISLSQIKGIYDNMKM